MANKFTDAFIESLPYADTGQNFFRDSQLKGLGLRIGTASKVFIAEGKVNAKNVRVTLGRHGLLTVEQARMAAGNMLAMFAQGMNPNHVDAASHANSLTLAAIFQSYSLARADLKPRTRYDYTRFMHTHFAEWGNIPVSAISPDMIRRKHRIMGQHSEAQANLAMRFMRSLFNFAMLHYKDKTGKSLIADNPTKILAQRAAWYRVAGRQTVISPQQLPAWLKAVHILPTISTGANKEAVKDYLLLLMFTGLRREEGLSLQWNAIDFKAKTLKIGDIEHMQVRTLPLGTFLYYLLKKRHDQYAQLSPYVFSGSGKQGYMTDPSKRIRLVIKTCGFAFTQHDLRRTFIAIAESLDVPSSALKQLISTNAPDINGASELASPYTSDWEMLVIAMQKITDYLMGLTLKA